ncbi:unnamed protein product [Paramecium sonneborni]|uniref:LisH domain-containing protein n=1 Tax=Paramecium sonneborni TaxID=65129 RepID=A0A8S1L1D8_9CILI|nr:unnamed protein product [Paramecium sonneborni]
MRAANSNQGQQTLLPDVNEINEYIKEYLRYSNYYNTFECFEAEIKSKQVTNKMLNKQQVIKQTGDDMPRIFHLLKSDNIKSKREINLEKESKQFNKNTNKYFKQVDKYFLQAQIYCNCYIHQKKQLKMKIQVKHQKTIKYNQENTIKQLQMKENQKAQN